MGMGVFWPYKEQKFGLQICIFGVKHVKGYKTGLQSQPSN